MQPKKKKNKYYTISISAYKSRGNTGGICGTEGVRTRSQAVSGFGYMTQSTDYCSSPNHKHTKYVQQ